MTEPTSESPLLNFLNDMNEVKGYWYEVSINQPEQKHSCFGDLKKILYKVKLDAYQQLLVVLDQIFSILRLPWGAPTEEDYSRIDSLLKQAEAIGLDELRLNHTPKWHCLLTHVSGQFRELGGFGCMQDDFIEFFHQTFARLSDRLKTLRDMKKRANLESKYEEQARNANVQNAKNKSVRESQSRPQSKSKRGNAKRKQDEAKIERTRTRQVKAAVQREGTVLMSTQEEAMMLYKKKTEKEAAVDE